MNWQHGTFSDGPNADQSTFSFSHMFKTIIFQLTRNCLGLPPIFQSGIALTIQGQHYHKEKGLKVFIRLIKLFQESIIVLLKIIAYIF